MAQSLTDCDHVDAQCVESSDPKDEGTFHEHYECPCGATGYITGHEDEPPAQWTETGEVFR